MVARKTRSSRSTTRRSSSRGGSGYSALSLIVLGFILGCALTVVFYSVFQRTTLNPVVQTTPTSPSLSAVIAPSTAANKVNLQTTRSATTNPTKPGPIDLSKVPHNTGNKVGPDEIGRLIQKEQYASKSTLTPAERTQQIDRIGLLINQADSKKVTPVLSAGANNKTSDDTSSTATTKKTKFLQVGAYSNESQADSARARLLLLGLVSVEVVNSTTLNNKPISRIRIGPFSSEGELLKAKSILEKEHISSSLIP